MATTTTTVEVTFGAVARFTVTVRDAAGNLATPDEIRLQVEVDDVVVIAEGTVTLTGGGFVLVSLGVYEHLHTTAVAGTYEWRIESDNPAGALEGFFIVPASRMAAP